MTQNKSLVSVIIPCYNYGHLLHETLDSVISQTYRNLECIVVDDGSIDNTREVAQRYANNDFRIKYFYQENKGLSGARNSGLRIAKGDYIQLLDADDILSKAKIQNQVSVLDLQSETDLVYGTVYIFEKDLAAINSAKPFLLQTPPQSGTGYPVLQALVEDNMFLVHCALFRSSIIRDVGYFNESMITCEDWNFWFRCALVGKRFLFVENPESKVFVRSHGINMSANRKNMWIGKAHFRKEAARLMDAGDDLVLKKIKARNSQLFREVNTRLQLAYGNIFSGIFDSMKIIFYDRNFFGTIRDSLYWIKERLLHRV